MKYVIDPTVPFTGALITSMRDDKHSDYGNETLEELKARQNNPNLITVEPEKVSELVKEHRTKLNEAPFEEIDEERYYDLMDCVPPARMLSNSFFVGECYQYDLHLFCFSIGGRYFSGNRILNTPKDVLKAEITKFYSELLEKEANAN